MLTFPERQVCDRLVFSRINLDIVRSVAENVSSRVYVPRTIEHKHVTEDDIKEKGV